MTLFTGATNAVAVASTFSDTVALFQLEGKILPAISMVAPKVFLWLRPCLHMSIWRKELTRANM